MTGWTACAVDELLRSRHRCGGWGYRSDLDPSVEATALACLGIWSCRALTQQTAAREAVERGARWLRSLQAADGSLGITSKLPNPGWATPHAVLIWNALAAYAPARQRATAWLLEQKGTTLTPETAYLGAAAGHDATLVGWPWVADTHSWIEPTAMAILALQSERLGDHPRVAEGVRLILNRALREGGWNYGNTSVFGRQLRPQPGPTGLALLALASQARPARPKAVDPAIAYLLRTLPAVRAPLSLAWGVLGLRAWNACPVETPDWLADSFTRQAGRRDAITGLSLLLLAQGNNVLITRKPE